MELIHHPKSSSRHIEIISHTNLYTAPMSANGWIEPAAPSRTLDPRWPEGTVTPSDVAEPPLGQSGPTPAHGHIGTSRPTDF